MICFVFSCSLELFLRCSHSDDKLMMLMVATSEMSAREFWVCHSISRESKTHVMTNVWNFNNHRRARGCGEWRVELKIAAHTVFSKGWVDFSLSTTSSLDDVGRRVLDMSWYTRLKFIITHCSLWNKFVGEASLASVSLSCKNQQHNITWCETSSALACVKHE